MRAAVQVIVTAAVLMQISAAAGLYRDQRALPSSQPWWSEMKEDTLNRYSKDLKNEMRQKDAVTYELGTPQYEILNPEEQPDIITEDHADYHKNLIRYSQPAFVGANRNERLPNQNQDYIIVNSNDERWKPKTRRKPNTWIDIYKQVIDKTHVIEFVITRIKKN